ncbi:kinase-like domain-containing protein [Echria macrotheca]|uniref:non-specific serine/threonine protein kinase n=1 Tax=Echria macrotheca TaxID=438768 RepID=A0AAJ0BGM0_9PEZI|nr:kinase-like domain-containing protein [Echria macrotheca]
MPPRVPDILVAVDIGPKLIAVRWTPYSPFHLPDVQLPIRGWPGDPSNMLEAVPAAVAYDTQGDMMSWGFYCGDTLPDHQISDCTFVHVGTFTNLNSFGVVSEGRCRLHDVDIPEEHRPMPDARAKVPGDKCARDLLEKVYSHVKDKIDHAIGGWSSRTIHFLFHTTGDDDEGQEKLTRAIHGAGFGSDGPHHFVRFTTPREVAADICVSARLNLAGVFANSGCRITLLSDEEHIVLQLKDPTDTVVLHQSYGINTKEIETTLRSVALRALDDDSEQVDGVWIDDPIAWLTHPVLIRKVNEYRRFVLRSNGDTALYHSDDSSVRFLSVHVPAHEREELCAALETFSDQVWEAILEFAEQVKGLALGPRSTICLVITGEAARFPFVIQALGPRWGELDSSVVVASAPGVLNGGDTATCALGGMVSDHIFKELRPLTALLGPDDGGAVLPGGAVGTAVAVAGDDKMSRCASVVPAVAAQIPPTPATDAAVPSPAVAAAVPGFSVEDAVDALRLPATSSGELTEHQVSVLGSREGSGAVVAELWARRELIGQGSYGRVWVEECSEGPRAGQVRAVKVITLTRHHGLEYYRRELEAHAIFSQDQYSEHFVKAFGWWELGESLHIALEYFSLRDLERMLKTPATEHMAWHTARQVAQGLQFMHDRGYAHRDLKPQNILVVAVDPHLRVKLSDFGMTKRATSLRTELGTTSYMAPEVSGIYPLDELRLSSSPDHPRNAAALSPPGRKAYTTAVDIWSLGTVVYRMLTREMPFSSQREKSRYVTLGLPFPSGRLVTRAGASAACIQFVERCAAASASARLTAGGCLASAWLAGAEPRVPEGWTAAVLLVGDRDGGGEGGEGGAEGGAKEE